MKESETAIEALKVDKKRKKGNNENREEIK